MMALNRRRFLTRTGLVGGGLAAIGLRGASGATAASGSPGAPSQQPGPRPPGSQPPVTQVAAAAAALAPRARWVDLLTRVATPVLDHLARGTLKARMPVETAPGSTRSRRDVTHLEALGRTLAGIAPWLTVSDGADVSEARARERVADLARRAIASAVDPASPDRLNFTDGSQPLVDAAILAQALLRAPAALWDPLDDATRRRLVDALESTRGILPGANNWLLFSATVEAALSRLGARWDRMRVDYAIRQHDQWHKGDGAYGDGAEFHWDYYNSFVIQPMLLDVLDACGDAVEAWKPFRERMERRAQRYAVQERFIAPDGSFPPIGRSLAYRCGAFHLLAQTALRRTLPSTLPPAQVRGALTAVITRTLDAPGTFDEQGWLRIGLCGHQPGLAETYISTGSLYLCTTAFLPLGLPATDPFWRDADLPWTSVKAWSGQDVPIDRAL